MYEAEKDEAARKNKLNTYEECISKMKISKPYKKGDRVRILTYLATLKYRKNKTGKVMYTNGPNLIYVRPSYCKWEIELYPNEIERIK